MRFGASLPRVGAVAMALGCACARVVVIVGDRDAGDCADFSGVSTDSGAESLDVATVDMSTPTPSCADGLACGGSSCCDSKTIPGGTFMQGRATAGPENDVCSSWFLSYPDCDANEQPEFRSTVSSFALDTYEVTVGRFRKFVAAYPDSQPIAGAGAHPKIAGSGWDVSWTSSLPADRALLIADVACDPIYATWTDARGANENKPINCVNWYTAFAFCAWDGGRLPTEAEWELAASGGEDRVVPWEVPPIDTVPDSAHAVFDCLYDTARYCTGVANIADVGSKPLGVSRWGQQDMAGGLWEWSLDVFAPYDASARSDYANVVAGSYRVMRGGSFLHRGGSFLHRGGELRAAKRGFNVPRFRTNAFGVRCARSAPRAGEARNAREERCRERDRRRVRSARSPSRRHAPLLRADALDARQASAARRALGAHAA